MQKYLYAKAKMKNLMITFSKFTIDSSGIDLDICACVCVCMLCMIILCICIFFHFVSEEQKYVCSCSFVHDMLSHSVNTRNLICLYYVTVLRVGCICFTVVSLRKVVLSLYALLS